MKRVLATSSGSLLPRALLAQHGKIADAVDAPAQTPTRTQREPQKHPNRLFSSAFRCACPHIGSGFSRILQLSSPISGARGLQLSFMRELPATSPKARLWL
eukprot:431385-Amphidinium_carterae.1